MGAGGGHAWLGGMRGCGGGIHGCRGACMVVGEHAWLWGGVGGMHGGGGMHGIQRDTVNEQAVHILLECILVVNICLGEL